jgi:hypothetical protein
MTMPTNHPDVLRPRSARRDGVLIAKGSARNCLRGAYLFADCRRHLDYDRRRRDGWARLADFLLGELLGRKP